MLEKVFEIGGVMDELDYKMMNKNSVDQSILDLLNVIEKEFKECEDDKEKMNSVEKIAYRYTLANYYFNLLRLIQNDFGLVKKYSSILKRFKDSKEAYLQLNIECVELYREALDIFHKNPENKINPEYIAQISTNLGNLYFNMGRIVGAIKLLKETAESTNQFPMAFGNYALKCFSLIDYCTDNIKNKYLLEKAIKNLNYLLDDETESQLIDSDQVAAFEHWRKYILETDKIFFSDTEPWDINFDINQPYKDWCASKSLALNYINIVSENGNVDDLHIPDMGMHYWGKDEGKMTYYAWFNIIKQEFNFSRYQLYQVENEEYFNHESQEKNILINSLDYPSHGYKTEKLKSSLKSAYAILDKVGLFCGHFFEIDTKPVRIDFNSWYKSVKIKVATESPFKSLYWLSKDFDFEEGHYKDIRRLRNVIEHRYLRVLDYTVIPLSSELNNRDKYEYNVSYNDLLEATYETLKLTRSAIFYMVNGFNIQYKTALESMTEREIFLPLNLDEYEDEWKN